MIQQQIQMVDLQSQYLRIKNEIDAALIQCAGAANYIKGPEVKFFEDQLAKYLGTKHVISCANGTDALQIALMALDLKIGDEIIIPAFTYVATAEAIALLGLKPVMVDVDIHSFNIAIEQIERAITHKTKAIVPVHLYGQSAHLQPIMQLAEKHNLFVIEDNAQAMGAEYIFSNGTQYKTGTIGHIGCHSFFPTKNLGCFGDGGALTTNNSELAERCRMIASHGQKIKYHHEIIGCNSRLDTLQSAVLSVKLPYLEQYIMARQKAARFYDENLSGIPQISLPETMDHAMHTYNQYTIMVKNNQRDVLQQHLRNRDIPTVIYYPLPLYRQKAFKNYCPKGFELKNTEELCNAVLSLPMHTELNTEIQYRIIHAIKSFFSSNTHS
jgi:dTDP-4-amino-4,6-dideoxygalactose transaminase